MLMLWILVGVSIDAQCVCIYIYIYERNVKENWSVAENIIIDPLSDPPLEKNARVEKLVSAGDRTRVYGFERHRLY